MAKKTKSADLSIEEKLEQALIVPGYEPYKIPDNWCWTNLKTVCNLDNGIKHNNESLVYFDAKTLREITEPVSRNSGVIVEKGQKVILVDGENSGEVFVIPDRGYMGSTFRILNISKQFDEMYIRYFIDIFREELKKNKIGSAIPHLNKELFYGLQFPLPPLPEQHRIVERIESLFSKLDEAKEKAQEVIDSFETRKAAILHKAFSGELTAKWREENGVGIESWKHKTLASISDKIFDGPFGTHLKSNDYVEAGVRVIRLENLKNLWFDDSKQSFVTKDKYETIKKHTVYPSDLIMSTFIAGEVKVCQIPQYIRFAINKADCIGIRLKSNVNTRFVLYYLSSKYVFNVLSKQIHGATRPRVNTKQIKAISVYMPDFEEQNEIVHILDNLFEKEIKEKDAAESVIDQIDTMKKAILARAFRGELGTNDPEEESAVELLKQILSGE